MTKSYSSKRISGRVSGLSMTVDMTLCRNLLCAAIGAVLVAASGAEGFRLPPMGWLICSIAGVAVGANYIVWVLALRTGVYVFANAANTASFIIAAFCGAVFWGEALTATKLAAIILILVAMVFMSRYQTESGGKPTPLHLLLLFLVFFTAGVSSATQKWFARTLPDASAHVYTFYSLLISTVLLFVATLLIHERHTAKERAKSILDLWAWIVLMAVCFYGVTFFQTKASFLIDAIILYPVYNGALLAAGNVMAWLCFSEKPSKNSVTGALLVFAAILLARL